MNVRSIVEIMIAEPPDHGMGEQDAGLGFAVGRMRHGKIGGRIDQHLAGDRRAIAVARSDGDYRCKIAAGAVAANHKARGVDAELPCVLGDPRGRGNGILYGGRKFVLGGTPVITEMTMS